MTLAINDLQEEFDENDSEIETVARDSIGVTVGYILDWFGIDIDVEDAIRGTRLVNPAAAERHKAAASNQNCREAAAFSALRH